MLASHGLWRLFAGFVVLLAGLSLLAGCGPTTKRIVFVTNGESPYWDACSYGLKQAAKDLKLEAEGYTAVMEVNDGTEEGQIQKLRQFQTQSDIVAVAISAVQADNAQVADEMRKLRAKGVKVICVDADVNREKFRDAREIYIGTDNIIGGRLLGTAAKQLLKARMQEKGSYAQFVGKTGSHNAIERMGGFGEAVGKEFMEAARMGDNFDRQVARDNVSRAMTNFPDLVALVGIWSYNAPAIAEVAQKSGNRSKYTIVTFDAEPGAIKNMHDKLIDAMVVQNPYDMGYQSIRYLKALLKDDKATIKEMYPKLGEKDGDLYDTGLKLVVPDSETPLKAEQFGEFGGKMKFLKLSEFQKWLDDLKLEGS